MLGRRDGQYALSRASLNLTTASNVIKPTLELVLLCPGNLAPTAPPAYSENSRNKKTSQLLCNKEIMKFLKTLQLHMFTLVKVLAWHTCIVPERLNLRVERAQPIHVHTELYIVVVESFNYVRSMPA